MAMDARKFRILQAIIDDYVLTAIPVGSRTISKKYETGLSSATIRNEMSDLEELGYLDQPHVSAGRVPSAKAYRLYVDELLRRGRVRLGDVESISGHFSDRVRQMEDIISHTAQVLSNLTAYTALVTSPKRVEMRIRNLQFVPVSSSRALLVIVTDCGIMRDAVIRVGGDMDADTLYTISRSLTEQLAGHTLSEAKEIIAQKADAFQIHRHVLADITELISGTEQQHRQGFVAFGGVSNILNFPEYSDVEKARNFLALLEGKEKLLSILEQHEEMAFTVRIGPETGIPELSDCSIVTATYRTGDYTHGEIGVIGPTRMDYGRVLGILGAVGEQLSSLFWRDEE